MLEFGLPDRHALGQVEGPYLLAEDFRVEERFGFDSHLPGDRVGDAGKKPSAFVVGPNIEHPTTNVEPRNWRPGSRSFRLRGSGFYRAFGYWPSGFRAVGLEILILIDWK